MDGPRPLVLTVKEASRYSGLARDHLYQAVGAGTLKAIRRGRKLLIPVRELEAFVDREAR